MTFSIAARDGSRFGMAVSSSSPAVAARCLHLRPGIGVSASQNVTDPRLGTRLLDGLAAHGDAARALATVVGSTAHIDHRQLTVLGASGPGGHFSGAQTLGTHAAVAGDGVVAAGNLLSGTHIPDVLVETFTAEGGELEERLFAALLAGLKAGGEAGPVHSAGLAVVADVDWRVTDLRVDWDDAPVDRLGELLRIWLPQRDDYVRRGLDPAAAPAYGVPGDL
ncbi:DUF1028 domain-containing protein [Pseudonocardia spinosispora]|uniref:DUF1028 domain-containing protein n=1 Tax=Pseudonocardia spinosispora TaxID=103441 RepID=UPI0003F98535|nr:DUF1028 domain-containing protein [Pseudonocardia spinosispora]